MLAAIDRNSMTGNKLYLYDLTTRKQVRADDDRLKNCNQACFSSDSRFLYFTDDTDKLRVLDLESGDIHSVSEGHTHGISGIQAITGTDKIVTCGHDRMIKLRSLPDFKVYEDLTGHKSTITNLFVNYHQRFLFTTGSNGEVKVWSLEEGHEQLLLTLDTSPFHPVYATLSDDEKHLAVLLLDERSPESHAAFFAGRIRIIDWKRVE